MVNLLSCMEEARLVYPDSKDLIDHIEDIKSKITDRTKAIVIINPNNPTGAVYPEDILLKIADIAREHELMIFSDEIYDRLVMDGIKHTSIAALAPDLVRNRKITYRFHSFVEKLHTF